MVDVRPVGDTSVLAMLWELGRFSPLHVKMNFVQMAVSISRASNQDPIFPEQEAGAEATACILVALAWAGSRFDATLRRGRNLGVFQIRLPEGNTSSLLSTQEGAAFVAIDRLRESLRACEGQPWPARLAGFMLENGGFADARASGQVLGLAQQLFRLAFPHADLPPGLPPADDLQEAYA